MIKLLIGGSPCTHWSIAQKNNRETEPEGLGWELFKNYLIAKEKFQPDLFLYENNKSAAQAIKDQIAEELGVGIDPDVRFTYINSALVSAQNRQRFYVTNFGDIEQPEDRGILLKDILETGDGFGTMGEKGFALTATYAKGDAPNRILEKHQRTTVAEPVNPIASGKGRTVTAGYANKGAKHIIESNYSENPNKQTWDSVAEPVAINATDGGDKARTLMAGYYKFGTATLLTNEGFKGGTTCVAEPVNATSDGKSHTIKAQYYKNGVANFVTNGGFDATAVAEPCCVAQRGRYADTGNRAQKGNGPVEQFYEARVDGKTNTLTTVQKDNNVAEAVRVGCMPSPNGEIKNSQAKRIYSIDGKSVNLVANGGGEGAKTGLYAIRVDEPMRVREATKQGYVDINVGDCVDLTQPNSKTRRGRSAKDKSNCLTTTLQQYEYCGVLGYATPCEWDENGIPTKAISCADGKIYTVYEVKDGQITIKGKQYPIKLVDGYYIIRKLTPVECERLQTLPDGYTKAVSDSQRYRAIGNGWTAEIIIWLLNHALKDVPRDEEIVVLSMYDGIATGRYCLDKMGFTNVKYHAYEIDKYPIQVAMDNYPDIIQHGDAFAVREDDWKAPTWDSAE